MSTPRAVLLVGEGNFSFSAALCHSSCSERANITATCLQSQEETLQHEGAANNIKIIRDAGGLVFFEVDCTRLRECPSLQGLDFDRVIFNFPHCGRKSGVKKNRELLKNFFLSCVQVLSEDGEVHVALCNGQGGTPADQPMREWHNSWQVVAMASEAGLILKRVQPFDTEKVESYQCTGYRSQDKGFHVEKALLHVFTRSLPYSSAEKAQMEEIVDGERVHYYIPAELSDYILRDFLSPSSAHPVRLVQDFLLTGLADEWLVSMMTKPLPLLLTAKQLHTCHNDIDKKHCYWIQDCQRLTLDVPTSTEPQPETEKMQDQSALLNDHKHTETSETLLDTASGKGGSNRHQGAENLRTNRCLDISSEGESGLVLLDNHQPSDTSKNLSDTRVTSDAGRASKHQESENLSTCHCLHLDSEGESCLFPSLVPKMKELLTQKPDKGQPEELLGVPGGHRDREDDCDTVKVEDLDSEGERAVFLLRPSLCPQMQELLPQQAQKGRREESLGVPGDERESEEKSDSCNIVLEGSTETEWNRDIIKAKGYGISDGFREGNCEGNKTVDTCEKLLCAASGLVFQNLPITPWSPPVFHQLLLMGTFPTACEPIPVLVRSLWALLAPYGVCLAWEQGYLCLTAEPMGLVGKVWTGNVDSNISEVSITVLLNLDLLAVLMYSLPDWRLLWSRDPCLKEFLCLPHPSPGKLFQPFSLYPQKFSFDISFWTSTRPGWDETRFHSLVREASHGTVEQVTLIDKFSHPDLSQTSYCYRLVYRSHTHALSHTQALRLHTHLQDLLSARLKVTIR